MNALWPRTTIATAAIANIVGGEEVMRASRTPEIVADAAHVILTKPAREFTGNFCIDDTLLWPSTGCMISIATGSTRRRPDAGFFRARGQRPARAAGRAGPVTTHAKDQGGGP